MRASRILVSTRLYPADLQTAVGQLIPGSDALFLPGLSDEDALDLWRAFGVSGARDALLPLFNTFDKHPLLIQALASEVASYHRAPGDFDKWRKAHPDFNPFGLSLVQVKSHVLEFALRRLDDPARKMLSAVAAFRMPASYDTLAAVLVGDGKPFADERALDVVLSELEDRGLLGWDRRANRYDLHPIVRGVVWSGLDESARRTTYGALETHFKSLPTVDDEDVECLEDLTGTIELYHTLVGLGRYNDASDLFVGRLEKPTLYRLSASRQQVELLGMLFPDGLDQLPRLRRPSEQAYVLVVLGLGYHLSGQPRRAVPLYRMHNAIRDTEGDRENLSAGLHNLSDALRISGALRESEVAARRALSICRGLKDLKGETTSLDWLGITLAARGVPSHSAQALGRSVRLARNSKAYAPYDDLAVRAVWVRDYSEANAWAVKALELAERRSYARGIIQAARLQGEAALGLNDLGTADGRLHHALTRARAVNLVEEELPALVALAELRRRQGDPKAARELLDDVWESAERGPYPLLHADAFNVLVQIERDAGNREAAIEAATKAYRLAWCDGPPFAYHCGLEAAKKHLRELGAPEPTDLPPFDESKFEPVPEGPEVEINPPDEFHE